MSAKNSSNTSSAAKEPLDWAAFDVLTDEDIRRAVAADPDAAPIVGASWFKDAELVLPGRKRPISIRLDPEVLDYFMAEGPGYQSRINAALLQYVRYQRRRTALLAFWENQKKSKKAKVTKTKKRTRASRR
jgi:uncharacterized protein (DUF4415 family)